MVFLILNSIFSEQRREKTRNKTDQRKTSETNKWIDDVFRSSFSSFIYGPILFQNDFIGIESLWKKLNKKKRVEFFFLFFFTIQSTPTQYKMFDLIEFLRKQQQQCSEKNKRMMLMTTTDSLVQSNRKRFYSQIIEKKKFPNRISSSVPLILLGVLMMLSFFSLFSNSFQFSFRFCFISANLNILIRKKKKNKIKFH